MQKYQIKIGQISWFENAKGLQDLKEKVSKTIKAFHPLNSSEEGAEEYRKRFRDKPFYYKLPTQKDFVLCYNN